MLYWNWWRIKWITKRVKLSIFIPQLVNYLRKFKREEIYFELVKVDCFPFLYFEDTHTHTHTHTIYIYIYVKGRPCNWIDTSQCTKCRGFWGEKGLSSRVQITSSPIINYHLWIWLPKNYYLILLVYLIFFRPISILRAKIKGI